MGEAPQNPPFILSRFYKKEVFRGYLYSLHRKSTDREYPVSALTVKKVLCKKQAEDKCTKLPHRLLEVSYRICSIPTFMGCSPMAS